MVRAATASTVLVLVTAVVLAAAAGAGTSMSHPKLVGVVGKNDAFKITLKTANGKLVKTIKAGTYTFVIHDDSSIHAFDLSGPHGFLHAFTTIPFVGTKAATLKLKAGKYKAFCPNHASEMFQHFTVK
jgi:hypothetical protein